jgi:bile acid:Na+ symporter, BASS family
MSALLPAGLAFLMLVVGLRLTWDNFRSLWQRPLPVLLGLALQVGALPLLALLIARFLDLPPGLSLGLLVVAAAPGGITSNFIAMLARGDVALSTTMTLATSFVACLTIPLVLAAGGVQIPGGIDSLTLGIARTGLAVMAVSIVPLVVGLVLRRRWPVFSIGWAPMLNRAATFVFFGLVIAAFAQNWSAMLEHFADSGVASILLNAVIIALAFLVGEAVRLPGRQTLAIAIECGLQNVAMAMFVASTVLKDDTLMIPALIYAVIMNISALALLGIGRLSEYSSRFTAAST